MSGTDVFGRSLHLIRTILPLGLDRRSRLWSLLRLGFGSAALGFLALAFSRTLHEAEGRVFSSPPELATAGVLVLIGLLAAGRSWSCLFGNPLLRPSIKSGYYIAQVVKYIPGSLWQPAAQAASASRATGTGVARASGMVVLHMLVQLASGATVGASLSFAASAPAWIRVTSLAGALSLVFLRRKWMVAVLTRLGQFFDRAFSQQAVPDQRLIVISYLWSVGTMLTSGSAFSILWAGFDIVALPRIVSAFGFAWAVGFLAVPFPSGVGVREWVLVATLANPKTQAAVIAAAGAHRLVTIVAELLAILGSGAGMRLGRRRS